MKIGYIFILSIQDIKIFEVKYLCLRLYNINKNYFLAGSNFNIQIL